MQNFKFGKYSLGMTAGIITSMGLIAGLSYGENTKLSIITGLLIIAVADNISDSLGIHIYKETESTDKKDVLFTTLGNFLTRLIAVFTFIAIVAFLPHNLIVICASIWGLALLALLSFYIARRQNKNPVTEIIWHLVVAVLVIIGGKFLGNLIIK